MYQGSTVAWLRWLMREEPHHVLEMRQFPYRLLCVGVGDLRLCLGDSCKGGDLAIVEPRWFAKGFETDGLGHHTMQLGQGVNCILPSKRRVSKCQLTWVFCIQCSSLLGMDTRHRGVSEMPAV